MMVHDAVGGDGEDADEYEVGMWMMVLSLF